MNIYTDSQYAFATAHVHGQIYKQGGLVLQRERLLKINMELSSCWRLSGYQLNWPLFTGWDTKKTKGPKLKVTTMQIKLSMRLLSGNPNPRPVLELSAAPESPLCLTVDGPGYHPEESKSYPDSGSRRVALDGGSYPMEESACQRYWPQTG